MKFSSSEKKMLVFCVVAIALPLGVGLYWNHINATPIVNIPPPPLAPKPNGYDLYVAAMAAMTPANPPVDAVNNSTFIADPKVRARQYSLARKTAWLRANNSGFILFNSALKTPSMAPAERGNVGGNFAGYAQMRQLARVKTIESNARWMRRDYNGALQSGLDTVQMGHDMRRGGVAITGLVGIAVGAIGRYAATADTIEHLDAKQAKAAARRLEKLLQTRWTLAQTLTEDKHYAQSIWLDIFKTKQWRSPDATAVEKPSLKERIRLHTIPKQRIMDDLDAIYARDIANAKAPYLQQKAPLNIADNPFNGMFGVSEQTRDYDARDLVGDNFLMLRLALRAYQLENGAPPPNLTALVPNYIRAVPADPFGGGEALSYKVSGKSYLLWSIGPDGRDNGGTPIPPRTARTATVPGERPLGTRSFTDFEGKGDVVAGVNG